MILSSFQYFIIVSIPQRTTVWNTNDDRYSDFENFFENVETSVYIEYLSSLVVHTAPLCGILTMTKYWKLDRIKKCGNVSTLSTNRQNQEMWICFYIETFPHSQK